MTLAPQARDPYYGYGVVRAFDALAYAGPILPTPHPVGLFQLLQAPRAGSLSCSFEDLWGTTQTSTYAITNPANSTDNKAFNGLLASSTGPFGGSAARRWTFTAIDDTTLTAVAKVDLELSFYMSGWADDTYYIQVFDNTNPACVGGGGWRTVSNLKFLPLAANEAETSNRVDYSDNSGDIHFGYRAKG